MSTATTLGTREIKASFAATPSPVEVRPLYRVAIGLVAVGMVLLPLAYLSLVALACYGLLWHALEHLSWFSQMRSARGALTVYLVPLVVGGIGVLFMIKPLFAPRPKPATPISLSRDEHPELFALVETLCAAVGAPKPSRIDVNCDVNASASFRRGLLSLFSNDLVLTIGLPLLRGLTLRQLTGVLAHELGHFAQGSGMRVSFVVRTINAWFAEVVFGRDEWDLKLAAWARRSDIRIGIVLHLARGLVWVTRQILKALMYVGHTLSCFLLRQMEFDADRYEARVAGSAVFGETMRRMPLIAIAHSGAMADLSSSWRDRQLIDDFTAVVTHNLERLPTKVTEAVARSIEQGKTGLFDTHPCDRERIASAAAEASEGVFRLELPAQLLLRDYAAVARRCSLSLYAQQLGSELPADSLLPSAEYLRGQRERDAEYDALRAFFDHPLDSSRALRLDPKSLRASGDADADRRRLSEARARICALREGVLAHYEAIEETRTRWINGVQAEALLRAGLRVDAKSFGLAKADLGSAEALAQTARQEQLHGGPVLTELDSRLAEYLHAGLSLALCSEDLSTWLDAQTHAEELLPALDELERETLQQAGLLNNFEGNEAVKGMREAILARSGKLHGLLKALAQRCAALPYPFEHSAGQISLAAALVPDLPSDADAVGDVIGAAAETISRIARFRERVLARLLITAQRAAAG